MSLAHDDVVPHIIIQSSRLRLGEFETHAAKGVLQHYPGAERTSPQNAYIGEVPGKGFALMPADEATASGITGAATAQQRLEKP